MHSQIKYYLKKFIRQGFTFRKILDELNNSQYYSKEQLEELQNKKLRKLIKHCYKNVPYYKELFDSLSLKPKDIQTNEDLNKLPIMDKQIVRDNFDKLIAKNINKMFCSLVSTSGTTGSPLKLYRDYYSINFENAVLTRHYSNFVNINSKKITLRGQLIISIEQKQPPYWEHNSADNELLMSSYHLSTSTARDYIDKIKEFNPKIIHAYPSSAYLLAQCFKNAGEKFKFDAIFTTSEKLTDEKRKVIEEVFDCKIYDEYGQAERTVAIHQCESGNYHIVEDYSIVEILETEKGQELVGTALNNYVMPLIRYKTGDTVQLSDDKCQCGRNFRMIKELQGRDTSYHVVTNEGSQIIVIDRITKDVENVIETQFVQEKAGELIINIVVNDKFSTADKEQLLKSTLEYTSLDMNVIINVVSEIPRGANGKFHNFIQKLV